jgi:hypothetical protein
MSEVHAYTYASADHASQEILTGRHLSLLNVLDIEVDPAQEEQAIPSEVEHHIPGTTLDVNEVKRLLESNYVSTPLSRIVSLMDYAWAAGSIVERSVPSELLPYMPDSPGKWYMKRQKYIDSILRAQTRDTHPDRYTVEDIVEETRKFETTPFLTNALRIKKISWSSPEGTRIELGVRVMLHEANKAFQAENH